MDCCRTWDTNEVIAETLLMRAVLDAHPVVPGHALVYPWRHVESFVSLTVGELIDVHRMIAKIQDASDAEDFTIAVNDGEHAGRTVPHLHVHVIPRRAGDVADAQGGVRRLFAPAAEDTWLAQCRAGGTS